MEFKSPVGKRGRWKQRYSSLPILGDIEEKSFIGYFNGCTVVVSNPNHIEVLYSHGFFGKGSLSRSFPSHGKYKSGVPPILSEQQWKRRKEWESEFESYFLSQANVQMGTEKLVQMETEEDDDVVIIESDEDSMKSNPEASVEVIDVENVEKKSKSDDITVIDDSLENKNIETNSKSDDITIIEDSLDDCFIVDSDEDKITDGSKDDCRDDNNQKIDVDVIKFEVMVIQDESKEPLNVESIKPRIENLKIPIVIEELHLLLEEAFFLSFALGCLIVTDMISGEYLDTCNMWSLFCSNQDDFIESYIAYHYFRAKGWIVKSGLKFGGQFLLYKDGPPYYHASYIVRIESVNNPVYNPPKLLWEEILAAHRMAEASNKEVLTCQILWPDDLSNIDDPNIIRTFKVSEALLRRWQPCKENDVDDHVDDLKVDVPS